MLTYQEIVEALEEIERNIDVTSLTIDDIHVWPLLRRHLGSTLIQKTYNTQKTQNNLLSQSFQYLDDQFSHAKLFFRKMRDLYYFESHEEPERNICHEISTDVLFISRPEDNTDQCNRLVYNRHIDPFVDFIKTNCFNKTKWLKLEENKKKFTYNQYYYPPIFFDDFKKHSYSAPLNSNKNITNFKEFTVCKKVILGDRVDDQLLLHRTIYEYERILTRKNYFCKILKKINPAIVFFICYYSSEILPIVWACKELNIISVDIQHGKQGKYHHMYSHWTQFPDKGYCLLPDYFWNWGKPSQENISKWHPKHLNTHIPVVGGNLWLSKWKYANINQFEDEYRPFLDSIDKKNKLVLVTLQPLPNPLEDFVLKAMKATESDLYWLIRLHPRQQDQIGNIENILKTWNITNYEISNSTLIPLYSLLKRIDLHITAWSSTSLEALYFNKHTIIIHENGKNLYNKYINEKLFSVALNYDSLINKIIFVVSKPMPVILNDNYIQTDEALYQNVFNKLIDQSKLKKANESQSLSPDI